jgi:hypothetical protein
LASSTLQGGEVKTPGGVVANYKLHEPIAEVAHAIEENGGWGWGRHTKASEKVLLT